MGNARDFFSGGSFLKWNDIGEDELDQKVLTISNVEEGVQKDQKTGGEKPQLILQFKQTDDKKFGLNNTNLGTIIDMLGDDYDDWAGQKITLYITKVKNPNGGTVMGIRVKAVKAKAAGAAKTATETITDEDIPF